MRALWILAVLLLAGCAEEPVVAHEPEPSVITDPTDLAASAGGGDHIHDYWNGQDRLVLLDQTKASPIGFGGAPDIELARFRPEPGSFVPQGTASVEITLSWSTQPDDHHGDFQVWVKTAQHDTFTDLGPFENGGTTTIMTEHADNDLPHQIVSNWVFLLTLDPDPTTNVAHYWGEATLHVEVVRGLEIPLYPGHPDRWQNQSEIRLLDETQDVPLYFGDPESTFIGCATPDACLRPIAPPAGTIVPPGTASVVVELTWTNSELFTPGLRFHGADDIVFERPAPTTVGAGTRTYIIQLDPLMADGPYAIQSLWEFLPDVESPLPDQAISTTLHIQATAHRDAQ